MFIFGLFIIGYILNLKRQIVENKCLVSIIVPVHNTADYLHKCIESLRSQTLQQIEIILVDNLSVDGSSEICDEYAKIDKRIKVLHLSIAGLSIARNAGMRIASAPYIGFVDSDDYVEPAMFEKMLDAMVQSDMNLNQTSLLTGILEILLFEIQRMYYKI